MCVCHRCCCWCCFRGVLQTPEFYNFSRLLLKVPEHTWGVDIKKTLHDFADYSNTRLHACLPPHLRRHWAPGYVSSDGGDSSSSRGSGVDNDSSHSSASSKQNGRRGGSWMDTSGDGGSSGNDGGGSTLHMHADSKAPCLNYGHCIKAWNRQAAYIDWALQVCTYNGLNSRA